MGWTGGQYSLYRAALAVPEAPRSVSAESSSTTARSVALAPRMLVQDEVAAGQAALCLVETGPRLDDFERRARDVQRGRDGDVLHASFFALASKPTFCVAHWGGR